VVVTVPVALKLEQVTADELKLAAAPTGCKPSPNASVNTNKTATNLTDLENIDNSSTETDNTG
jgi:hypothetical protein